MDDRAHTEEEIRQVEAAIRKESESGLTDESTKHVRVRRGIYSMRLKPGQYVIRVRVPAGLITALQLDLIADIVEHHAASGVAHLTTRQGIEMADVPGREIGPLLRRLAEAGLTTMRTGGNVVRNIVCCPLAGVEAAESFDVTPYALSLDVFLRIHPDYQAFPRKIKIAFEGCPTDHVRTTACDIGLRARRMGSTNGFQILVAGGLGSTPIAGQVLEDFTPLADFARTVEAILRVFNREGNRSDRAHARMKWLVRAQGIDKFRFDVLKERDQMPPSTFQLLEPDRRNTEAEGTRHVVSGQSGTGFENWKRFNTMAQNKAGQMAAWIYVPLGNLTPAQLRVIAETARRFSADSPRLSIEQNILLRQIPQTALPELHRLLEPASLGACSAERVMDITRCVGSTGCLSAITNPVAAARELGYLFQNGLSKETRLRDLRIRVSGCPNSCSHHYAAEIGLFGTSRRVHDRPVPHYALVLGGQADGTRLGKRIVDVPARQVVPAVNKLLRSYLDQSAPEQPFWQWATAIGTEGIKALLGDLVTVPAPDIGPEFYRDLEENSDFSVKAKEGECSA